MLIFARVSVLRASVFITPDSAKWKLSEIHSRDIYFRGRSLAVAIPCEMCRLCVLPAANDTLLRALW